jgi:hypothetical protein
MASIADHFSCPVCTFRFTSSGDHEPIEYGCGHKVDRICARQLFGEMNGVVTRCSKFRQATCRCPICRIPVQRYWKDYTFASAMDHIPKPDASSAIGPQPVRINRILVQPIRANHNREAIVRSYEAERVVNEVLGMLASPFGVMFIMIMLGL